MKVHVSFTVDVDDEARRLIGRFYGTPPASRRDVRSFFEHYGTGGWETIGDEAASDAAESDDDA